MNALQACTGEPALPPLPVLPPRQTEAPPPARGVPAPLQEWVIAFTGDVSGEIEPCGCPTVPYGGFRRRMHALERLRAEGLPVFVLDAGNMLVKGLARAAPEEARARGGAILEMARATGLDAWAPAPNDLLPGGLALLQGPHAVSATWGGLPPVTVLERGGVRVGVVGVSEPEEPQAPEQIAEAVRAAMAGVAGEVDLWVALGNAPAPALEAVAALPGVGVVLSTAGVQHEPPRPVASGGWIVEAPGRGRFVTVLRVSAGARRAAVQVEDAGVWKEVALLRERAALQEGAARAASEAKLAALRPSLEAETAGRIVARVDQLPLGSDLDAGPPSPIDALLAEFAAASVAKAKAAAAAPAEVRYVGAGNCASCHADFVAAWALSDHARARESLVDRKADTNPECVGCHSTGFGEPSGFGEPTPAAMDAWGDVQCEACHGPASAHPGSGVGPHTSLSTPTRDTCVRCHDPANSPSFDPITYLSRVSCVSVKKHRDEQRSAP